MENAQPHKKEKASSEMLHDSVICEIQDMHTYVL